MHALLGIGDSMMDVVLRCVERMGCGVRQRKLVRSHVIYEHRHSENGNNFIIVGQIDDILFMQNILL